MFRNPFNQNMKAWGLINTLLQLTQLRDRALDIHNIDEVRRYNTLIKLAQQELLKSKTASN